MREVFARVIDPEAFNGAGDANLDQRRQAALGKADQILAMEFAFEDLPPELKATVAAIESDLSGVGLLTAAAAAAARFPPIEADDGRPVYTAIVKPLEDGTLFLAVLVCEAALLKDDEPIFVGDTFKGDEARRIAAEIEVAAAGGGRA